MEKILAKFNEATENAFAYLKLSSVDVFVRKRLIEIHAVYPADKEREILDKRAFVEETFRTLLRSRAQVHMKFRRSHFDFDFFKADFFAMLSAYPTLANTLADKDVTCHILANGGVRLRLTLAPSVYDYCRAVNIAKDIEAFLDANFCEPIELEIVSSDTEAQVQEVEAAAPESAYVFDRPQEGRMIRPENVEEFIGKIIYEPASYIEDIRAEKESVVLCGTLSRIFENTFTAKSGEETKEKIYYRFSIEDFTGKMSCVYYPSQKTIDTFRLLQPGKQIVARGKVDLYKESLSFKIRDISLCTLPKAFAPNRMRRRIPDEYTTVFPQPYVVKEQSSLFDAAVAAPTVAPFLRGKTFVVFDLETTGVNPDLCKIIEIGAVKVVDGKVTETFSAFIDPEEPLTEKIIKLTHIEDADLRGKPKIDAVLPDFYKFVADAIMVGQYVQFDHGFIQASGAPMHIYFDNVLMDTLSLARTYVPGLRNYKLETIAKHFGVVNKGAHRAIYDAWATWEVFAKIAEKMT